MARPANIFAARTGTGSLLRVDHLIHAMPINFRPLHGIGERLEVEP